MATEEETKVLAFSLWERDGRPEGMDQSHYFEAKRMLEEREAIRRPAPAAQNPPVRPATRRTVSRARKPKAGK